jgi:hypothetical protein
MRTAPLWDWRKAKLRLCWQRHRKKGRDLDQRADSSPTRPGSGLIGETAMSQQITWRCKECDAVVTVSCESDSQVPNCPICGLPKEAPGKPKEAPGKPNGEGEGSDAYDTRAGTRFADTVGPEVDRLVARRVLGDGAQPAVPPYSSEDWAATALAELVGRHSNWSFHLSFCGTAWMATFTEKGERKKDGLQPALASLVSATGRTRALAISRALLKVTRCPRWNPLGSAFLREEAAPGVSRSIGLAPRRAQPAAT